MSIPAIRIFEKPNSGSSTVNPPTLTKEYGLVGIEDDYIANAYALAGTETTVVTPQGVLYRQDLRLEHEGHYHWSFTVTYGKEKKETGKFKFSFDTTGATIHVGASKATAGKYPAAAPDHERAIGVKKSGDVEGANIVIPALKLNYAFMHPAGMITEAKAVYLAGVTGRTNSVLWHGFEPGEVLLLGAVGSDGTDAEAEVNYGIAASKNATGLTIGSIANIAKKGHDLLWISYKKAVAAGKPATQPEFVYVERVYDEVDFFAALGF